MKKNEASINIHEPGNTVWRETDNHRGKSHQHIKEWEVFLIKTKKKLQKKRFMNTETKLKKQYLAIKMVIYNYLIYKIH